MAKKRILDQKVAVHEERLLGFYFTKIGRPGHETSDIEQLFVRFGVGQEVNNEFELFGSDTSPDIYTLEQIEADQQLLAALEHVETLLLQRRANVKGGTVS